jgi:hypothetical protein
VEPGSEHKGVAKICAWWGSVLTYCATQAAEPWFWPIMTYRFTAHYDLWVYRGFSYVNPPTSEGQFDMEIELGFDIKSDDLQNHDI